MHKRPTPLVSYFFGIFSSRPPRRRLAHELEERGAPVDLLGCVPLRSTFLAHRDAGGRGSDQQAGAFPVAFSARRRPWTK